MHRLLVIVAALVALPGCPSKAGKSDPLPPPSPTVGDRAPSPALTEDQVREATLAAAITRRLERDHLTGHRLDDAAAQAAFTAYLDRLDPAKLFLLAADRDALAADATRIDDQLAAGDLSLAHAGAARYAARVAVVDALVAELLAAPLDHTDREEVELDGDKLGFAATEAELRDRWRQRLELELLERTALPDPPVKGAPPPAPLAEREVKARTALANAYAGRFARLRDTRPIEAAADLINAVTATYDPHTEYLPPSDKANFDISMTGQLEGIGAVLREHEHFVEVSELVPGGAAWRHGGLTPGDLIIAVTPAGSDPIDIADMHLDDVVKMIRGPKGTTIGLTIKTAAGDSKKLEIVRDRIVIEATYARGAVLSGKGLPALGYVYLPSFYGGNGRDAADDVRALLERLAARGVAGLVLDLRGNGGGLLDDAVELSGLFIDRGPVVQVADADERETLTDDAAGTAFDRPLVVMVDRFSASASEIVAAALQDYRRAVVVGAPTHGKGTVQQVINLDRDSGGRLQLGSLKLTIQQFYRVNGASTQLDGVTPDIALPDLAAHLETAERTLPHAIAASRIAAVDYAPWAATWDLAALRAASATRVGKQPLFAKVTAVTRLMATRKGETRVPLARADWEAFRARRKAELDAVTPALDKAPATLTVELLDPPPAPTPGERVDDRLTKWRDSLTRDPWLDEAARVLAQMTR
ncbi:MAG: carboxy terminal-processing peptidase [Kofleriaceae bacterium]|jgi:carboxyl-terminal processing protease|nr:carboxy terminal-processing peptidase [Kofleriaceae bacterium]MBP9170067.1 carboxy terminal-processing peptidase [Kofleriaceae bacterium]MBP9858232.1 carboxy terminal-processing peptidase [Kofleriaceae bacterium]